MKSQFPYQLVTFLDQQTKRNELVSGEDSVAYTKIYEV